MEKASDRRLTTVWEIAIPVLLVLVILSFCAALQFYRRRQQRLIYDAENPFIHQHYANLIAGEVEEGGEGLYALGMVEQAGQLEDIQEEEEEEVNEEGEEEVGL